MYNLYHPAYMTVTFAHATCIEPCVTQWFELVCLSINLQSPQARTCIAYTNPAPTEAHPLATCFAGLTGRFPDVADIVAAKMQVFNVQNTSLLQCDAQHVDALAGIDNGTVSSSVCSLCRTFLLFPISDDDAPTIIVTHAVVHAQGVKYLRAGTAYRCSIYMCI